MADTASTPTGGRALFVGFMVTLINAALAGLLL